MVGGLAIDACCHRAGEHRGCHAGPEELPVIGETHALVGVVTLIGFDEIAAEILEGQAEQPLLDGNQVLVPARPTLQVLEKPSVVLLRRREVEGEEGMGTLKAPVDVAVGQWVLALLIDIDEHLAVIGRRHHDHIPPE